MYAGKGAKVGLLVACLVLSGCAGIAPSDAESTEETASSPPVPATSEPRSTGSTTPSNWSGAASLSNVSVGNDVANEPEWTNASHQPIVEVSGSVISVTGRIPGISDLACRNVSGDVTTSPDRGLTLTIRSETEYPDGEPCNQSLMYWAYDARITVDGQLPDRIHVRHLDEDDPHGDWSVAIDSREATAERGPVSGSETQRG